MTIETFEKACELNNRIEGLQNVLDKLEEPLKDNDGFYLNNLTYYDEDYVEMIDSTKRHLSNKINRLKKQFANLK